MKQLVLLGALMLMAACTNGVKCRAVKLDCKVGAPCPPEVYRNVENGQFQSKKDCDTIIPAE